MGLTCTIDTRDSAITPTKGSYLELEFLASPRLFGSSQDFSLACLDARTCFVPLPSIKLVIAIQARAELASNAASSSVKIFSAAIYFQRRPFSCPSSFHDEFYMAFQRSSLLVAIGKYCLGRWL